MMLIPRGVAKDTLLLLVLTTFGVKRNGNESVLFITVKEAGISSLTVGKRCHPHRSPMSRVPTPTTMSGDRRLPMQVLRDRIFQEGRANLQEILDFPGF